MWEAIFSWDTLWWFMLICYIPCCIGLIVIVLLQKGKGLGSAMLGVNINDAQGLLRFGAARDDALHHEARRSLSPENQ